MGEKEATGAIPVPLRATTCGLPLALSNIVSAPVETPRPIGLNTTLMVQLDPEERVEAQLFVCKNGSLEVILLIDTFEPLVFSNVAVCGELEVATNCDGNVTVDGDKDTVGRGGGANSYAPGSTVATPSLFPSVMRGLPSKSVAGKFGAELSPASITGDPCVKWKSPFAAFLNSGSAEILPGSEVESQTPNHAWAEGE